MTSQDKTTLHLRGINRELLHSGQDEDIVQRVANGIYSDPERRILAVRVHQLGNGSARLVYQTGEKQYEDGHKFPADYFSIAEAQRKGYVFVTSRDPRYDPSIEGPSQRYDSIFWPPDKIVSIELKPVALRNRSDEKRMASILARMFSTTLADVTISDSMTTAREMQSSLMPQKRIVVPGYEISWMYQPAEGVGGDFMFFRETSNESFVIGIGDSQGHGLGAATNAVRCVSYAKGRFRKEEEREYERPDLANDISDLNEALLTETVKIVGVFLAEFRGDRMTYVNGGHNPPFHINTNGLMTELSEGGMVLGVFHPNPYVQTERELVPGDVIFLYTDGLTESKDHGNNFYAHENPEKLSGVLTKNRSRTASSIIRAVWRDNKRFRGSQELYDDTFLGVVKYTGLQ